MRDDGMSPLIFCNYVGAMPCARPICDALCSTCLGQFNEIKIGRK